MINTKGKKFEFIKVEKNIIPSNLLKDRFIVPPFSIFDTRQGYWQERKRLWLSITGNLSTTRDNEFGKFSNSGVIDTINGGTSNFDPVLAEIIYTWFTRNGSNKILDPFGGEQTKGVVARVLGHKYKAVEFRQEQVAYNNSILNKLGFEDNNYVCGDSNDIDKLIPDNDFTLCFTSPPYYDLEVYSKEDMSALGTYEEFMQQYENIFKKCIDKLVDNSFLVVKVADIRDKKTGAYRGFVADNIKMFQKLGLHFYNDIVLLNAVGTGAFRANTNMKKLKVVKLHQNILVFYKGDMNRIQEFYTKLDLGVL